MAQSKLDRRLCRIRIFNYFHGMHGLEDLEEIKILLILMFTDIYRLLVSKFLGERITGLKIS